MAVSRWTDHVQTGDHASRPAANAVAVDALYACTDHDIIYQSDGASTWANWHDPDVSTAITTHESDTTSAHTAEGVDIVDAGNLITATNVEAALQEMQGAIDTDEAALTTHAGAADPHAGYVLESLVDAKGDIITATADNTPARLAVGTDGQVLSAASGEATGLSWVAAAGDVATDAIFDAKGDLAVGTGADTAARLAVGTDTHVLTADSAEATGLKWAAAAGGGAALTVTDESGTVADTAVTSITVPDGMLVDNGVGDVTIRQAPTGVIGCTAEHSTTQALASATLTPLNFDTDVWDSDGFHDPSTNNTRMTIPAGLGGKYLCTFTAYSGANTPDLTIGGFKVDGTEVAPFYYTGNHGTSAGVQANAILDLAAGSYVEACVWDNGAGTWGDASNANQRSTFSILKLGSGTIGETIGAKAYYNTTQGSLAASTVNALTLNTEDWDTDSIHSGGTFTIPAGMGGKWLLVGRAFLNQAFSLYWYKNGSVLLGGQDAPANTKTEATQIVELAAGDTLQLIEFHSSGTATAGDASARHVQTEAMVVLLATAGSGALKEGTVFPVGPATGDRYRRTDLDYMVFFYDGTRWRSEQKFLLQAGTNSQSATGGFNLLNQAPVGGTLDLWVLDVRASTYVAGTSDGSNYWTVAVRTLQPDNTPATFASFATSADTGSTWTNHDTAADALWDVSAYPTMNFYATKTSAPGNLIAGVTVEYQVIAT